jgi:hypothetical protein
MKEFIKRWLLLFAMIVLSVHIIGSAASGEWGNTSFILELLLATLVIRLLQLLTAKIPVRVSALCYLIDLGAVLVTVLFFGWLWKWYTASVFSIIITLATIIPVFVAAMILDVVIVRRDVDIINKQIKRRQEKLKGNTK